MNDDRHDSDLPPALRMQLRALRTPQAPARELWPDIAARLAPPPRQAMPPRRRVRLLPTLALAAALVLAVGLGWQLQPKGPGAAPEPAPAGQARAPLLVVADAMTREYHGALRELPAPPPAAPGYENLLELDANAAVVREALAQAPEATFLLQRLQHIHARRLALTRQLASA